MYGNARTLGHVFQCGVCDSGEIRGQFTVKIPVVAVRFRNVHVILLDLTMAVWWRLSYSTSYV